MRCLILDDEEPARIELRRLLSLHPAVEIVGEASKVATALELTARLQPQIAFVDVALRGETGFDYVARAAELEIAPHVIFVTAHDRHAVRAFECNALDYLLKPVITARLEEALRRIHERRKPEPAAATDDDSFFLQTGTGARFVAWKELLWIEASGNYTRLHFNDGSSAVMLRTLKDWLVRAPKGMFLQIHRKLAARRNAIAEVRFPRPKSAEAVLCGGMVLPVSRGQLAAVRKILGVS